MADSDSVIKKVGGGVGAAAMLFNSAKNISSIKNSMFGSLPRAMLFVPNNVDSYKKATSDTKNEDIEALRKLVKKRVKSSTEGLAGSMVKSALGSTAVEEEAKKKLSDYKDIAEAMAKKNYSVMEMQYNPSSLRLSGRGGGSIVNVTGATDSAVAQSSVFSGKVMVKLSCELVFEQINVHDAFLMEGMSLTAGNVASMAGNMMTNLNKKTAGGSEERSSAFSKMWGNKYSVQVPVEGLLSLLNFRRTRQVIFFWSDMFFHGNLTSVNAQYTMFNKLGNPVMAKVGIMIEQPRNPRALYESDEYAWDESFDGLFGEAGVSQFTRTGSDSLTKGISEKIMS